MSLEHVEVEPAVHDGGEKDVLRREDYKVWLVVVEEVLSDAS